MLFKTILIPLSFSDSLSGVGPGKNPLGGPYTKFRLIKVSLRRPFLIREPHPLTKFSLIIIKKKNNFFVLSGFEMRYEKQN